MTSRIRKFFQPFGFFRVGAALAIFFATAITSSAQTFTVLVDFDGTDGTSPYSLVQGVDGDLYGVAYAGAGTVFKITTSGTLTTLHHFCALAGCADGQTPVSLVQAIDGNFYGTTQYGGINSSGTVFKITPAGKLTTLHSFCTQASCSDGSQPFGLMQAANGTFYGTTNSGGVHNAGTVYKVTPAGTLTTLHSFNLADGANPFGQLVQGTDGNFYGTTVNGGTSGAGTVFKITPAGKLTTLHSFNNADGANPYSWLVQATDGNFYATAGGGGAYGGGTVFRITPAGTLTTLYNFCSQINCTDGAYPQGGLVQASDGQFYGTTSNGGDPACFYYHVGCGTAFQITPGGTLTTLHIFESTDGMSPKDGLVQATDGNFYGATESGGTGNGTVFSIATGLGPFVSFLHNPAKVGQTFGVLGQGLTGTSSVSFNGTPATFKVLKDTFLTAVVPTGATTVPVTVTTPSGVLTSNTVFRVTPQVLSFDPTSGPVGTVVTITGVSFTQATGVGFGSYVPANFTVNSDTQLTATVPTGAKTGPVGVQTPGGTGISSAVFTVTQ